MLSKTLTTQDPLAAGGNRLLGIMGMSYALFAYGIGAGALFWVFFVAGGFAPYGFTADALSIRGALITDLLLVLIFAVQHTVMARRSFKQWVTRFIPSHLERATFVLMSGIAMGTLVYCWQDLPGVAWSVEHPLARGLLFTLYILGILYVLGSSLVTNHFELFGLRQAYLNLINRPYRTLPFKQRWMYRYSRHPMMLGILMVLWASPEMSATRFCLAALLTIYVFTGIRFEERGLVQEFGERYQQYRREIGLFFTLKCR